MNARHGYAGPCALLALFLATLAGCTDSGKCERGTNGCLPRPERHELGRCDQGLSNEDGICVDNGGAGDGDGDGDGDGPRDAGPMPDVDCKGDSVEELCGQFCELFCYNQIRFCGTSECAPVYCEPDGLVLDTCAGECGDDIACAKRYCESQTDPEMTCDDFGAERTRDDGVRAYETFCIDLDPLCVQNAELGCSDVCGSRDGTNGDYVGNDICEDGHETSTSSVCDRGTDCTDCTPHPCKQAGVQCQNHGDCCGFYGIGALCVDPDARQGDPGPLPPVCSPFCDGTAGSCPENFTCRQTTTDKRVCVPQ
jgi:hypothetical protein